MNFYSIGLSALLTSFVALAHDQGDRGSLHDATATRIFGELKGQGLSLNLPNGNTSVTLSFPFRCDQDLCTIAMPICDNPKNQNCDLSMASLSPEISQRLMTSVTQNGTVNLICVEPETEYVCQGSLNPDRN